MDRTSSRQLEMLRHIDLLLSQEYIRFWLRGGWAVDFLLGQITRRHADLDLVVWQRHRQRIHQTLEEAGFQLERELPVQTDLMKDGLEVTFVFIERSPNGSIVGHGIPEWIWQPDALPLSVHCLHGVCARVVAAHQMLDDHEGYEAATGRSPRPKDAHTREALRRLIRRR